MKITFSIIGLLVVAAIAGTLFLSWRKNQFQIVHPRVGDLTEAVYGLGKVKSQNRYEVIIGVINTVKQRFVNEGDFVRKGSPLIQFEDNVVFKAPFNGTVTLAKLYPGETALPQTPLMRVEDLTRKFIELSLEQQSILRVRPGQPAKITFESLRGQVLNGWVTSIYPSEDEFLTRIDVKNLEDNILPGMTADVSIEIGSIKNATLVPLSAVVNGTVLLRRGHRWEKLKVEVDHVDGNWAEIQGGLLTPEDELRVKASR